MALFVFGAVIPLGIGGGLLFGAVDSYLTIVGLGVALTGAVAGPMLGRRVRHQVVVIVSFALGIATGVLLAYFNWVHVADWYYMKRCRDGVASACVESFMQGSARSERDDYYAPRRACELGEVIGCGVALKHALGHRQETCHTTRKICSGKFDVRPEEQKRGCRLVEERCSTPQRLE